MFTPLFAYAGRLFPGDGAGLELNPRGEAFNFVDGFSVAFNASFQATVNVSDILVDIGDGANNFLIGNLEGTDTLMFTVWDSGVRRQLAMPHMAMENETHAYLCTVNRHGLMECFQDGMLVGSKLEVGWSAFGMQQEQSRHHVRLGRAFWQTNITHNGSIHSFCLWNKVVDWNHFEACQLKLQGQRQVTPNIFTAGSEEMVDAAVHSEGQFFSNEVYQEAVRLTNKTRHTRLPVNIPWEREMIIKAARICAEEGETCRCSGRVYAGPKFFEGNGGQENTFRQILWAGFLTKDVDSMVKCSPAAMGGDPSPSFTKRCWCVPPEDSREPHTAHHVFRLGETDFDASTTEHPELIRNTGATIDNTLSISFVVQMGEVGEDMVIMSLGNDVDDGNSVEVGTLGTSLLFRLREEGEVHELIASGAMKPNSIHAYLCAMAAVGTMRCYEDGFLIAEHFIRDFQERSLTRQRLVVGRRAREVDGDLQRFRGSLKQLCVWDSKVQWNTLDDCFLSAAPRRGVAVPMEHKFAGSAPHLMTLVKPVLSFDGKYFSGEGNDYMDMIQTPDKGIEFYSGFSIAFTARWDAMEGSRHIIDFGRTGAQDNIIIRNNEGTSVLGFHIYDDGRAMKLDMPGVVIPNEMHRYMCSISIAGIMKCFMDGRFIGYTTASGFSPQKVLRNFLLVGKAFNPTPGMPNFKGRLEHLCIWDEEVWWTDAEACDASFPAKPLGLTRGAEYTNVMMPVYMPVLSRRERQRYKGTSDYYPDLLEGLSDDIVFDGAFSVTFVARWDSLGFRTRIIDFGDDHLKNNIAIGNVNDSSTLTFQVFTEGVGHVLNVPDRIVLGAAHKYLFSLSEDGHMKCFQDGQLIGARDTNVKPQARRPKHLVLGKAVFENNSSFRGSIAEVCVWDQSVDWTVAASCGGTEADKPRSSSSYGKPYLVDVDKDKPEMVTPLLALRSQYFSGSGAEVVNLANTSSKTVEFGGSFSIAFTAQWDAVGVRDRLIDISSPDFADNIFIGTLTDAQSLSFQCFRDGVPRLIVLPSAVQPGVKHRFLFSVAENGELTAHQDGTLVAYHRIDGVLPKVLARTSINVGVSLKPEETSFKGEIEGLCIWDHKVTWRTSVDACNEALEEQRRKEERQARVISAPAPMAMQPDSSSAAGKPRFLASGVDFHRREPGPFPDLAATDSHGISFGGEFSISFIARWDTIGFRDRIIDLGSEGFLNNIFIGNVNNSRHLAFEVFHDGTPSMLLLHNAIELNRSHRYLFSLGAGGWMRGFRDGKLLGRKHTGWIAKTVRRKHMYVGRSVLPTNSTFEGRIEKLCVWDMLVDWNQLDSCDAAADALIASEKRKPASAATLMVSQSAPKLFMSSPSSWNRSSSELGLAQVLFSLPNYSLTDDTQELSISGNSSDADTLHLDDVFAISFVARWEEFGYNGRIVELQSADLSKKIMIRNVNDTATVRFNIVINGTEHVLDVPNIASTAESHRYLFSVSGAGIMHVYMDGDLLGATQFTDLDALTFERPRITSGGSAEADTTSAVLQRAAVGGNASIGPKKMARGLVRKFCIFSREVSWLELELCDGAVASSASASERTASGVEIGGSRLLFQAAADSPFDGDQHVGMDAQEARRVIVPTFFFPGQYFAGKGAQVIDMMQAGKQYPSFSKSFSVAFTARWDDVGVPGYIFDFGAEDGRNTISVGNFDANRTLTFRVCDTEFCETFRAPNQIIPGEHRYLCSVASTGVMQCLRDGFLIGNLTGDPNLTTQQRDHLLLGQSLRQGTSYFHGLLRRLCIWDSIISWDMDGSSCTASVMESKLAMDAAAEQFALAKEKPSNADEPSATTETLADSFKSATSPVSNEYWDEEAHVQKAANKTHVPLMGNKTQAQHSSNTAHVWEVETSQDSEAADKRPNEMNASEGSLTESHDMDDAEGGSNTTHVEDTIKTPSVQATNETAVEVDAREASQTSGVNASEAFQTEKEIKDDAKEVNNTQVQEGANTTPAEEASNTASSQAANETFTEVDAGEASMTETEEVKDKAKEIVQFAAVSNEPIILVSDRFKELQVDSEGIGFSVVMLPLTNDSTWERRITYGMGVNTTTVSLAMGLQDQNKSLVFSVKRGGVTDDLIINSTLMEGVGQQVNSGLRLCTLNAVGYMRCYQDGQILAMSSGGDLAHSPFPWGTVHVERVDDAEDGPALCLWNREVSWDDTRACHL